MKNLNKFVTDNFTTYIRIFRMEMPYFRIKMPIYPEMYT